ncbi:hypothetical protein M0G43_05155 [Subsaxibacter sp. CAU 1640]|uniref:hypothetical protein n=1 Tax=Subsaxibacter sp. CAU 1640 TaxID=2933271 RepID=UPI0020058821|nr:hypothetical protein [Subsaxibacter sp. CAU 1640]MCK7589955.1 hypothetical protein [Subsaxibacter sp. CAU 1640]
MLGILLIYFIGKYFYKLAEEFNKNKWLFAILGVVVYYVGTFIGGILIGILDEIVGIGFDWDNNLALGLIALPFGIAAAYLFHYLLKANWEKSVVIVEDEIQDIGKQID